MSILIPPAILIVSIPTPYASATEVQQQIETAFKDKAVFIPEDPFGMPDRRVDMDGVMYPDGQDFALEITSSWVRVWVGKMSPPNADQQAHNRQQCERVANMVAAALNGIVEEVAR